MFILKIKIEYLNAVLSLLKSSWQVLFVRFNLSFVIPREWVRNFYETSTRRLYPIGWSKTPQGNYPDRNVNFFDTVLFL